jgi:serine/threonine-protein kinase RsbT
MAAEDRGELCIQAEQDIVTVRRTVREAATGVGFGITDVTRIVTSASELARNVVLYAGSGMLYWHVLHAIDRKGIELIFVDCGPGIADIALAMQQGYTTSGGLGMGLPGSKRLMDEMEVQSRVGEGTTVTVRKWQPRR